MTINYNKAEFIRSAVRPEAFIRDGRPQVTFAGRSNVGKSSVINRLLNRKNFARVGATPGKTTQVNYFLIDNRVYLTDLPGYGYAKVSKEERDRWGRLMESYFQEPGLISLGVLIVDARHKPTADDCTMGNWFKETGRPFVVVANKLDKLKKSEIEPNLQLIRDTLELEEQDCLVPFSAEKGTGKNELLSAISQRLGLPKEIIQKAAERIDAENVRFEDVLTRREGEIASIKSRLLDGGALGAVMSGTGSAVFGLFADADSAVYAKRRLARDYAECFLTETIDRLEV